VLWPELAGNGCFTCRRRYSVESSKLSSMIMPQFMRDLRAGDGVMWATIYRVPGEAEHLAESPDGFGGFAILHAGDYRGSIVGVWHNHWSRRWLNPSNGKRLFDGVRRLLACSIVLQCQFDLPKHIKPRGPARRPAIATISESRKRYEVRATPCMLAASNAHKRRPGGLLAPSRFSGELQAQVDVRAVLQTLTFLNSKEEIGWKAQP
jgi:hypothetical protein